MNRRIPILICIDVEPNERKLDPQVRVDWTGFEKSYEFFSELRPRLEMVTGLVFFECIQKKSNVDISGPSIGGLSQMEPQKSETFHRLRRQSKLRVMLVSKPCGYAMLRS